MMLDCWRRLGQVERSLKAARSATMWMLVITLLGLPIVTMTHIEGHQVQIDLGSGFWLVALAGTLVYAARTLALGRARRRLLADLEREATALLR
jgi:hypothetical protein